MKTSDLSSKRLFEFLLDCQGEVEVNKLLTLSGDYSSTWCPLGDNENNYGVIENQQASPIAALIEKITNSIDARLMRLCYEAGINPRSVHAPKTMSAAIEIFFGVAAKNWHLSGARKAEAETIQIVASGSKIHPCLLIYDDGEGQHPVDFEQTFLSILRGNKNEIPFVQGKYNMGGTGALVFCGSLRYQLIGSKRFDGSGDFGFTLVRKHPLTDQESKTKKNTWYEYMKINGKIPSFPISELDVGLANRKFRTGTIIKLYDYQLPPGTRGALPQEPRRAIDQYLFEPALPIYLVDNEKRYPNNKVLQMDCFGLKRRLEKDDNKYLEEKLSVEVEDHDIGSMKITAYVFRAKVEKMTVKETRDNIQREYFHDDMAVLFSLNGQVHGHFTSEFITRSLKMPLLKNHLMIHVDCTNLTYNYRSELFMASRDRMKSGEHTGEVRKRVASALVKSELAEVYKRRQNSISVEGGDAKDLLKAFSKDLPFNKDLMRLLNQTFKIEQHEPPRKENKKPENPKPVKTKEPFHAKRYPSFFNLKTGKGDTFITIPEKDEKTVQFSTDVENNYFDRSEDPGELKVSILQFNRNESTGGNDASDVGDPSKLIDIRKSSPKDGTIKIGFGATEELKVGDAIEIQAQLGGPEDFECRFWLKVAEPSAKPKDVKKEEPDEEPPGLPDYVLVYQNAPEGSSDCKTWEQLGEAGIDMDFPVVMYPAMSGDGNLERVYINMDSTVLRNHYGKQGVLSVESKELAEKKYISSVYFHTIFLFSITKNRKYQIRQDEKDVDLQDYLRDVFSSHYAEFILNFGAEQLMASLAD
ncbi:hypothetical protein [Prosthecobacter dejongeii]|uniref:Histidine kinase-, DNA gyrase B-, and HSP90-like ATPase n=1 Tax=Prosthecobacter dejongeii TaxID=48465 RepID=A0A7W7YHK3_9BACT|nr:hypothetical protein [Prosthecobacter dejongeii]MBB5036147.1 hypothetical protein [Prosthecobacter dejongeii]